jgi:hypothetical protein
VSRVIWLAVLGVIGCGRLSFDSTSLPSGDAGPIDSPPVPTSICKVDRIPITTPAMADLAITGTAEGYAAVWVDPTGAMPAHGVVLAPDHRLDRSLDLGGLKDTRLGGITDVGQKLVLSTGTGGSQTTWVLARDLSVASSESTVMGAILVHGPYPSDTSQSPRVFVSAAGTSVMAAYLASDGTINTASTVSHGTTGEVLDLACTDGPNHSHCVWAEARPSPNGASQCTASDVRLQPVPSIPGGPVVSTDCHDVRTSSGPDAADSMIVVWTSSAGDVEARYVGSGGFDIARPIALTGSAPKVQFDGTRFWIAWLDGKAALQLTSFDVTGAIVGYSLAGWAPIGPEAFELVRRGNETALVVLSAGSLDLLTICS